MADLSPLEKIRLEEAELDLELKRENVANLRAARQQKKLAHAQIEADLRDQVFQEHKRWANCNHRKGGRGMDGLRGNGSDPNFAVVKHRYPWNEIWIHCTRCGSVWRPLDTAESHPTHIPYATALAFPTDNGFSGASLFSFPPKAA
jgi:hypothetical protein